MKRRLTLLLVALTIAAAPAASPNADAALSKMRELITKQKWNELIAQFKNEDLSWAEDLYDYKIPRESQDWCTISLKTRPNDGPNLPLVLLIGDSITVRYAAEVGTALKGKAYVSLLGTSKAVGDPALGLHTGMAGIIESSCHENRQV